MSTTTTTDTPTASRVDKPRAPYPLIWATRFAGTYRLIAGQGSAS